jgi:dTDP-4-amino-4,6-dideoxygalactose transaminase
MIPIADPKASYLAHKQELDCAIAEVMESGWYILGSKVKAFEEHFADYLGATQCVGVANGTDAIQLALRAIGVKPGDAIITVSHTAMATVSAIDWIGAIPVLVDIDPTTYTVDPQRFEDTLREMPGKVKAIVAVHLYGHPADMDALLAIASRHDVALVEDCAQAHGAMVGEQKVGTIGVCGAFSFYPTKNLGAFGDAGAIVTSNASIADRLRLLMQYGWRERYISDEAGYNSRLDEIQAAILDCKLNWLDEGNQRRKEIAGRYNEGLIEMSFERPVERPGYRHVYHQYVIRCAHRDKLRKHLETRGIHTAILYPMPIHQQPGYRDRVKIGHGGLDVTESIAKEILSLPIYPELSDADVDYVVDSVRSYRE